MSSQKAGNLKPSVGAFAGNKDLERGGKADERPTGATFQHVIASAVGHRIRTSPSTAGRAR